MKEIKHFGLLIMIVLLITGFVQAQKNKLITDHSVGTIKLGMTVAKARKLLLPMKLSRANDIYSGPYIAVKRGKKLVLNLGAAETTGESKIDNKAVINRIEVLDSEYQTATGVRVGMLLSDAEKKYGKIKEISYNEEYLESVTFTNHPKDILFRIKGKKGDGDDSGIYEKGKQTTTKYHKWVVIAAIEISTEGN